MERRTLIAVVLTMLILAVWQTLFLPPPEETVEENPPQAEAPASGSGAKPDSQVGPSLETTRDEDVSPPVVERHTLQNADVTVSFSSGGGGPIQVTLKHYMAHSHQQGLLNWLMAGVKNGLSFGPLDTGVPSDPAVLIPEQMATSVIGVGFSAEGSYRGDVETVESVSDHSITFVSRRGGLEIRKLYSLPAAGYTMDVKLSARNLESQDWEGYFVARLTHPNPSIEAYPDMANLHWASFIDGELEGDLVTSLEGEAESVEGLVKWFGWNGNYFLSGVLMPREVQGRVEAYHPAMGSHLLDFRGSERLRLAGGASHEISLQVYGGPKVRETLGQVDESLVASIDYGMLTVFALPLLYLLKFFYGLVSSYGLAIILLTVTVKVLTFPLTQSSMKSMAQMREIQPELNRLKEQLGEDKEKLNQEMLRLFQEKKINPMGGCLPTLVQLPVWFALYRVLQSAIELYHTPFWYLSDLSASDPYGLSPIVLGVLMVVQQRMTPVANVDPIQAKMLQWMPVVFSLLMFSLPAGLVVYIIVNTGLSIVQQAILNRQYGGTPAKT